MALKAKPKFEYQRRDVSQWQKKAAERGGDFDSIWKEGVKVYKPKDGKNIIRLLPPSWTNAAHYAYDIYVNYQIGVDNQSYLSLSKMKGEADPIAEARKQAERDGDEKLAKALNPNIRRAVYLIDRENEDEGVQLWAMPVTLDRAILNRASDEDTGELVMVDDPYEGADIKFYREKVGGKPFPEYPGEKVKIFKSSTLHEDEDTMGEWLEFINTHRIPDMLNFYSYDHIAGVFSGSVPKGEGKASAAAPPPSSKVSHDEDGVVDEPEITPAAIRARLASKKTARPPWKDDDEE